MTGPVQMILKGIALILDVGGFLPEPSGGSDPNVSTTSRSQPVSQSVEYHHTLSAPLPDIRAMEQ
jgi:hypothetical protein